jgi:cytochrome b6-f complex iron-sulfur subunit
LSDLRNINREQPTTRRNFLGKILGAWSVVSAIPVGSAILQYLSPLKSNESPKESLRVAAVHDIAAGSAKIVRFNKEPVIVVHMGTGQFKAFSARCTHLGCIVKYQTEDGPPHFHCNCHGSEFDMNGKIISGPASTPLTPLKVSLQESSIIVSKV